jgi:hypothetical protein
MCPEIQAYSLCLKIFYSFAKFFFICLTFRSLREMVELIYNGEFTNFSLCFCFGLIQIEITSLHKFVFRITMSFWLIKVSL